MTDNRRIASWWESLSGVDQRRVTECYEYGSDLPADLVRTLLDADVIVPGTKFTGTSAGYRFKLTSELCDFLEALPAAAPSRHA